MRLATFAGVLFFAVVLTPSDGVSQPRPLPSTTAQAVESLPSSRSLCRAMASQRRWVSIVDRQMWTLACENGRLSVSTPMLTPLIEPQRVSAAVAVSNLGSLVDKSSIRVRFGSSAGSYSTGATGFGTGLWGASNIYVDTCSQNTGVQATVTWNTLPVPPRGQVYAWAMQTSAAFQSAFNWRGLYTPIASYYPAAPPYWYRLVLTQPPFDDFIIPVASFWPSDAITLNKVQFLCKGADGNLRPCAAGETWWDFGAAPELPATIACGNSFSLRLRYGDPSNPQHCAPVVILLRYTIHANEEFTITREVNCEPRPSG